MRVVIRGCRAAEIFEDPRSAELIAEYQLDCAVPEALRSEPQRAQYAAMEAAGALQCFAAYAGERLIGFASVLSSVMPHNGKRIGTLESLFVQASCRASGAWDALDAAANAYAVARGCMTLIYTARVGSALETILSQRSGVERTHTVFTRWLA